VWRKSARRSDGSFPIRCCAPPVSFRRTSCKARSLVSSELVSQRGTPPEAVYVFKHALVRDAAYGSLLRNARRQLHVRIADALETHSPEVTESQPELLAQHYAEAGLIEKSVAYWGKAAQRSAARFAMGEAAAQFQKGLDQLALLPDNPDRQRQELECSCGLAAVLQIVKGDGASETGHAYAQALELWERLGYPAEFVHVPWGKSRYHIYHGEFNLALQLADGVLHRSRQYNDSAGLVLGHYSSGHNLLLTGRFASCRSHLGEVFALYHPVADRSRRTPSTSKRTVAFGDCVTLPRPSGSSGGAEQCINRRGTEAGSSTDFGCELGQQLPASFAGRRRFRPE